jgi:aldose 1-epimerase
MSAPDGLLRVASGELEVELLPELGGRMHRLRAFGRDLLRTPADPRAYRDEPFFWGGFVMAPWCNRIAAGRHAVGPATVDLRPNFPDGTAIHGQVDARRWDVVRPGTLRVEAGGDDWPWPYAVTQEWAVAGSALRLVLSLANAGTEPMPGGIGIHPWFLRPLEIEVAAASVYASNSESLPDPQPASGPHDLRVMRDVPPDLDATWTDLRLPDALRLRWSAAGVEATARISPTGAFLCAASPAHLGAVAVEPQTHAPDGLRRLLRGESGALEMIGPGDALTLEVELAFRRSSGGSAISR